MVYLNMCLERIVYLVSMKDHLSIILKMCVKRYYYLYVTIC